MGCGHWGVAWRGQVAGKGKTAAGGGGRQGGRWHAGGRWQARGFPRQGERPLPNFKEGQGPMDEPGREWETTVTPVDPTHRFARTGGLRPLAFAFNTIQKRQARGKGNA